MMRRTRKKPGDGIQVPVGKWGWLCACGKAGGVADTGVEADAAIEAHEATHEEAKD